MRQQLHPLSRAVRVSLAERVLGVLFFFFGCSPGAVRASLPKRVLGVLFFFWGGM